MEQIYKGLGMINPEGSKKEIDIISKGATDFPIVVKCQQGKWGVWLEVSDKCLLVNPIALVNSLFTDGKQYDFFLSFEGDDANSFSFWTDRRDYSIEATLSHPLIENRGRRRFMVKDYVEKAQSCCITLAEKAKKEEPLAYDDKEISKEAIITCAAQMELGATLPTYYVVRTADVVKENFVFNPLNEEYHEQFEIKLGNRGYKTWLTHWDSDMEAIRHELESIVYEDETTIRLPFDMSETLIKIKKKSALDTVTDTGNGTAYSYKDYMLVEIHPNEFVHMPIIKGYCDKRGMIQSLYEGLLRMAMQHPEVGEEDLPSRMVAYNKYKSPLIESYLKDERIGDDRVAIRQVNVKHILTIDPDVAQLFYDEEGFSYEVEKDGKIDFIYDRYGNSIVIKDFFIWHNEINQIVIESETGHPYSMAWEQYHNRGIKLAQELRKVLSPDFDLWYSAPYEDRSGIITHPFLVLEPYVSQREK
ncbi:MAG: hypothetical protein IKS94_10375 [Prevotella sp.]|nr:hypothetical protein [Prevotella sp.]